MDIKLDMYEGPLDLLLKLIQKHEIDIFDLPIATLTQQYMEEVAKLPPNMEQLSEFLVMAATLLEIKSKMLLPRPKKEEEEPEDPREALVAKLLAYKQAQSIAEKLKEITPVGERVPSIGDLALIQEFQKETEATLPRNMPGLAELMAVFSDVINRKEERRDHVRSEFGSVQRERFSVTEKVSFIRDRLAQNGRLSLRTLFTDCRSKNEMVVTFLAVLEMIRRGLINATQPEPFSDVEVVPCAA